MGSWQWTSQESRLVTETPSESDTALRLYDFQLMNHMFLKPYMVNLIFDLRLFVCLVNNILFSMAACDVM